MNFLAKFDNEDSEINIRLEQHDERIKALIDGRNYELEVSFPEPEICLIRNGTKIIEARISRQRTTSNFNVSIGTDSFAVEIIDPRRLKPNASGHGPTDGSVELRAMMPGKVVRILNSEGSQVSKGDGVLVVEAMKMQNEIKSPRDGKVAKIAASEGATVAAGELLAVIE